MVNLKDVWGEPQDIGCSSFCQQSKSLATIGPFIYFLALEILVDHIAINENFVQLISLSSCFKIGFIAQIPNFVSGFLGPLFRMKFLSVHWSRYERWVELRKGNGTSGINILKKNPLNKNQVNKNQGWEPIQ